MRTFALRICGLLLYSLALSAPGRAASEDKLQAGYDAMYNLEFDSAHRLFREWEQAHPDDAMGPASDAAAYLFSEFDRLHILQSQFFVDDHSSSRRHKLMPDPATKASFERTLLQTGKLAAATLKRNPRDTAASLANVLRLGLSANYAALIDHRYVDSLSQVKQSRILAEQLLSEHPDCYDAYIAIGLENYLLSLKPAPLRWILSVSGAQTDRIKGLEELQRTADHGQYLQPYAELLLAVAALRDKNQPRARHLLTDLATRFPKNGLYRDELHKLSS